MSADDDLARRIARRIAAEGPLSVAAYMAMALHDPHAGYYRRRAPIGRSGDFITAPEISQIFGELIGLWCADLWLRMGQPDPVLVVELGPGRGQLLDDFLRAAATVPQFRRAIRLFLVEASPVLRAAQAVRLAAAAPEFADDFGAVPEGPGFVIANEFFDALPVRQLVRGRADWAERLVAVHDGRLVFVDGGETPLASALVPAELRDSPPGTVVEVCPAGAAFAAAIAARFARHPGAALVIDYGRDRPAPGTTLAAVRQHRAADVLAAPGTADLSAHVDFAALAEAAAAGGAAVYGPVGQGRFLAGLGAAARLAALCAASPDRRSGLDAGLARLIDPAEMGTLFKVLALASPGLPAPVGFEHEGDEAADDHAERARGR
ncbi:MAG TPA: SAM-dependent methyltransferase [Stellaceae bacterium]|nr:SAM-dependent methyltransferase [Stellaceae bacterium]